MLLAKDCRSLCKIASLYRVSVVSHCLRITLPIYLALLEKMLILGNRLGFILLQTTPLNALLSLDR